MTPEKLAAAMKRIAVIDNGHWDETLNRPMAATKWFVVDESKAESEVNWPGELISEHDTMDAADIGYAAALIAMAELI